MLPEHWWDRELLLLLQTGGYTKADSCAHAPVFVQMGHNCNRIWIIYPHERESRNQFIVNWVLLGSWHNATMYSPLLYPKYMVPQSFLV